MSSIIIQLPGFLTTVQDSGRYGYQRFGMPVGGAMDTFSLKLANLLVGNRPDDACLETTFTGPEILFAADGAIAVCGADMSPRKNGRLFPLNKTIRVKSGDILSFSDLNYGFRSYISFAGGIDVPLVMGSHSTYLRSKTGGFKGRALKTGDELFIRDPVEKIRIKEIPAYVIPEYKSEQSIRILHGPEFNLFDPEVIGHFLSSEYAISGQSDRMGYRLSGYPVYSRSGTYDIISAGISQGTIQIPGDGQPIILMADRQTTGGYNRIAVVTSTDLNLLAQMKPGDRINFNLISLETAQENFASRRRLTKEISHDWSVAE